MKETKTQAWLEYERGIDYKTRLNLYRVVDVNERFYAGDQWVGIPHEGLPTPVVNFLKYSSAWKISAVADRRVSMSFFAEGMSEQTESGIYAHQISGYCDTLWERLKMDYLVKEGLKQAAITGDYIQYFYWDSSIKTGQAASGDIATQLIDNVNYYPGNPNDPDVQAQPYIILASRELVKNLREEAKIHGGNAKLIEAEGDTDYTAGDRGKVELDDSGKCTVLLKLYKKDGKVWCEKSTRRAIVRPAYDTKLDGYPVALMNWETRKNSCHGEAELTHIVKAQVFINKQLAFQQLAQMKMSSPKVVYDKSRIKNWNNKITGAIPVNGDTTGAVQYLTPPSTNHDVFFGVEKTIDLVMRTMGANEAALGNIKNPDNTSAFIAIRDAALVPLQAQQDRFYHFIEDVGMIWLDFIKHYYTKGREVPVDMNGEMVYVPLDNDVLNAMILRLRIDVGPAAWMSDITSLQTLDNLLAGGAITFRQYLERVPAGHIPKRDELLEEILEAEQMEQAPGIPPVQ